jgi:hypothetical protein
VRAKLLHFLGNAAVLGGAVLACLAFLEFVVFSFILVPDDVVRNVSVDGVMRYAPGTRAVFRHPDGRQTLVTVNKQGWNSTKPAYALEKRKDVLRIAVVGDSYVHGGFIDVGQAFPEVLERDLKHRGVSAEVYRFGMDGAPLSQYLHVLRREVLKYRPDIVVVPLIHNDFDESYRFLKTRYASSFMKLKTKADGSVVEILPGEFHSGSADLLRSSRTFRYLYYETGLYLTLKKYVSRFYWGGNEEWSEEFISSAVDIRKIRDHERNRFFAHYTIAAMKKLADREGFKLAFVMDGVREAVYAGKPAADYEVGKLNAIAADVTSQLALPFLDLQQTFAADYARNHKRLEFSYDWHWNVHANRLIGRRLAEFLLSDDRLLAGQLPKTQAGLIAGKQGRGG